MKQLSPFVFLLFVATAFAVVWQFYNAAGKLKKVLAILLICVLLQGLISLTGFYQVTQSMPPRLLLLVGPGFLAALLLLATKAGKSFVDGLDLKKLTILHTLRIPVEITLFYLYVAGLIPALMTFEGYNFDIVAGISAPVVYYLVFVKNKAGRTLLLAWNFICLVLLANIVILAILSVNSPFQKLAFDQPNIGVTYFPFTWLPGIVVPLVLIAQLAAIRQLLKKR